MIGKNGYKLACNYIIGKHDNIVKEIMQLGKIFNWFANNYIIGKKMIPI